MQSGTKTSIVQYLCVLIVGDTQMFAIYLQSQTFSVSVHQAEVVDYWIMLLRTTLFIGLNRLPN